MRGSLLTTFRMSVLPFDPSHHSTSELRFRELPACFRASNDITPELIENRFSHDYAAARERFLSLSQNAGATITSYPLNERGPQGEQLAIDFAEIGAARTANTIVVAISGVHGSEGRAGSAIQQDILAAKPVLPPGAALILVHALNPFGMAYERRSTKANIDLNRNFTSQFSATPVDYYEALHHMTPTTRAELERAIVFFESLDDPTRRQCLEALSPGQYANSRSPFFGGHKREENIKILVAHLESKISSARRVLFLDIHTGLGGGGEDTLFFLGRNQNIIDSLTTALSPRFEVRKPEKTVPYFSRVHGSIAGGLAHIFSEQGAASLVHEIGTYPDALLPVLCLENFCAHSDEPELSQASYDLSREFFCPSSTEWRRTVLQRGTDILTRATEATLLEGRAEMPSGHGNNRSTVRS